MEPGAEIGADCPDALVIFGITGDLARKKTFAALYNLEEHGGIPCRIVGVGRREWTHAELREHAAKSIRETVAGVDEGVLDRLLARMGYHGGALDAAETYEGLATGRAADQPPPLPGDAARDVRADRRAARRGRAASPTRGS